MNDTPESGELDPVGSDEAVSAGDEDRSYDNLEDAMQALRDDDEEQPDEPEADEAQAEAEDETDSEADDEEAEDVEGEEPDADEEDEVDGDAEITLPDGSTITVSELEGWRAGAMRQADYTQKTSELARQREQVEALEREYGERRQFVESALNNFTKYLEGLIPPKPPLELAKTDPSAFQYQKELREAAIAEMQTVMQMREDVESHKGQASEADRKREREEQNAALIKRMPHLADPAKMDAFRKATIESAVNDFGAPRELAEATYDPLILEIMHYARLGKRAEHNRNNAKRRVETPKKAKAPQAKAISGQQQRNREAMRRLSKDDSREAAMMVDFD